MGTGLNEQQEAPSNTIMPVGAREWKRADPLNGEGDVH